MTSTLRANRSSANGAKPSPVGLTPVLRRQRSRPAAIGAGACAVVGMLGFVGVWSASSNRQAVLVVARPVKAGDAIQAEDLAIAAIPEDPALKAMPAAARTNVVGKVASVPLVPGALLVEGQIGTPTALADGTAIVAVEVTLAGAPIDALHPGDRVQIIKISKAGTSEGELGEVLAEGQIRSIGRGSTSTGTSVIAVIVPQDKAAMVAGASASQRAALVALPQRAT